MKTTFITLIILFSSIVYADEPVTGEETLINNSAELKSWCKNKSSEYFLAKDTTPYNWTASWWTEGEFLFVTGAWRVNKKDYAIKCIVRHGVAEKYASWEFVEEK